MDCDGLHNFDEKNAEGGLKSSPRFFNYRTGTIIFIIGNIKHSLQELMTIKGCDGQVKVWKNNPVSDLQHWRRRDNDCLNFAPSWLLPETASRWRWCFVYNSHACCYSVMSEHILNHVSLLPGLIQLHACNDQCYFQEATGESGFLEGKCRTHIWWE